jgi:lipoprotein NlpI
MHLRQLVRSSLLALAVLGLPVAALAQAAPVDSGAPVDCNPGPKPGPDREAGIATCELVWTMQAHKQHEAGNDAGAIESLGRAIDLSHDGQSYLTRGQLRLRTGDIAGARADIEEAVRRVPQLPQPWLMRAFLRRDQSDWAGARADLDHAHALTALDAHAWTLACELDLNLGRFEEAVDDAQAALEVDPGYVSAMRFRSTALVYAGDYDAALSELERAHERAPLPSDTRMVGAIQFMQGRYAASDKTWAAAQDDPTNVDYYPLWRYLARRRADPASDARATLRAMTTSAWPRPVVELLLGHLDAAAVIAAAQQAQSRVPEVQVCEASFYIGEAELDQRHFAEAARRFHQALDLCPLQMTERKLAHAELRRLEPGH